MSLPTDPLGEAGDQEPAAGRDASAAAEAGVPGTLESMPPTEGRAAAEGLGPVAGGHVAPTESDIPAAAGGTAAAAADGPSAADGPVAQAAEAAPARARRRGPLGPLTRILSPFRHVPHMAIRTKRGLLVLFFLVAAIGSVATVTGVVAVQWTETSDFCGRCHTMGPELKAYTMSPHREVACAECHVEPGITGWVKAKINGTKQLYQLLTGTFPTPIPAPDHADLPPTSVTCVKCHDVDALVANGGPVRLVLRNHYQPDQNNTHDTVALVLRPAGFGGTSDTRGVHWHINSDVEYVSGDPRAQKIDLVTVNLPNGTKEQFIAAKEIGVATDVGPDINRLVTTETQRRMDCIDCHNRIGHGIPSPDQAVDDALDQGLISVRLPYIKKEASDVLSIEYASNEDADAAIEGIHDFYTAQYPFLASVWKSDIDAAVAQLKRIYREVATPEMRVTAATYPDNLGHQTAPGCFRCHDGAHYKVVNGAVTNEAIPSACATCHTFPQIGAVESGVLIGQRPDSHSDRLWVFDHKADVTKVDPSGTTCGACHTVTYCQNCHNTPAVQVPHDNMVYNHALVVQKVGASACAYCHQQAYCTQCHANNVLPIGPAGGNPVPSAPTEPGATPIASEPKGIPSPSLSP